MIKKILIVEDEEEVRELLSEIFEDSKKYKILYARDGKEALRVVRVDSPDIILLDIQLPKLNGYEVCKLIKSDPAVAHTKILILSGMAQNCDHRRAKEVLADDYITKPFTSRTLVEKVEALLRNI